MPYTKPVYICSAKRSVVGTFGGGLSGVSATDLAATCIRALMADVKLAPQAVERVVIGNCLSSGLGLCPARQTVARGGLPAEVQSLLVNSACTSGLMAVIAAANGIELGHNSVVIAGGMENMSRAPYYLPTHRFGSRLGSAPVVDGIIQDALTDPLSGKNTGLSAEVCASRFSISRQEQDNFAIRSYQRAKEASEKQFAALELMPLKIGIEGRENEERREFEIKVDEEPMRMPLERISQLPPVYQREGTVTAGNSAQLADGAAVLLLCAQSAVQTHNLTPLARVVDLGLEARDPQDSALGPVGAIQRLLASCGRAVESVDLFEIHESSAAAVLAVQRELRIDLEKLNVSGGAIAIGHPVGCSGARMVATLVGNLRRLKKKSGVAAIANGSGESAAMLIELV